MKKKIIINGQETNYSVTDGKAFYNNKSCRINIKNLFNETFVP